MREETNGLLREKCLEQTGDSQMLVRYSVIHTWKQACLQRKLAQNISISLLFSSNDLLLLLLVLLIIVLCLQSLLFLHPDHAIIRPQFASRMKPVLHASLSGTLPPNSPTVGYNTEGAFHTRSIAFRHLPPNSATFGYATEGALFISAQLSSDAVSALRKVRVLI